MMPAQMSVRSSSGMAASSLPEKPRISKRFVTGNIGCADSAPNSNTRRIAGVICGAGGRVEAALCVDRDAAVPEQMRHRARLNSGGAFRGMKTPFGGIARAVRARCRPVRWTSARSSPVANGGRWHVMHEMSRLPLRILSNARAWPSFDQGGAHVRTLAGAERSPGPPQAAARAPA